MLTEFCICLLSQLNYALYPPFFLIQQKLNVLNECLCTALPVFCHNKAAESFVSAEKQESEWMQQRKGPASFVQSFKGKQELKSS